MSPPCALTGTATLLGAVVLCALPDAEEVRLAADAEEREDDALALLLLDPLAELALALALEEEEEEEEALALSLDMEAEELALALESDAEEAEEAVLVALADETPVAVEAARAAVLVAPWTWKPLEKL
jgi:hypothetical protein